jgi:anthranilate synthase component 1
MRLVSEVTGEFRLKLDRGDALQVGLPVGMIGGASKVRAMEIIDALEDAPRIPYGGVGWCS